MKYWQKKRFQNKTKVIPRMITLILFIFATIAGRLLSIRFDLLDIEAVRMSFGDLPILLGSLWLGPGWGMCIGGVGDLLGYALQPLGPYLPQLTLIAMLQGFLPGFLVSFTGESIRVRNLAIQIGTTQLISSIILTPLVIYQAFATPILENMLHRMIVQLFTIPFYGFILLVLREWKSREKLLKEQSLLEQILEITGTGINITDSEYNLQYVDSGWQKVYGAVQGEKCYQYFKDLDAPCAGCGVPKAFASREVIVSEEVLPKEDNRRVEVHTIPFQDESGEWLVAEFNVDITARKQIEEALQESQEKLRTLFASMSDMVVFHQLVFGEEGQVVNYRITDCNRAFTRVTGITPEEAVGKLATEVYQTDTPPYLDQYSQAVRTGRVSRFDTYYAPMDKYFSISVLPMGKDGFATVTTDMTTMKEYQQLLAAKNRELEQLVYIASHDLRSPLVNVDGYSRELLYLVEDLEEVFTASHDSNYHSLVKTLGSILPELKDFLAHIRNSSQQMDALLQGLLQLSRTGKKSLKIRALDMDELVGQVVSAVQYQTEQKGAKILVEPLPSCGGDWVQVTQVFINLVDNALKFLHPQRQGVIRISGSQEKGRSIYCVEDNGIGIAPAHQEKIFQLFHRLETGEKEGEGLGLTIIRQLLFRLDGEIWVESQQGTGSRFFVSLPQAALEKSDHQGEEMHL